MESRLKLAFPVLVVLIVTAVTAPAQPTIYLVRHAEKLATWSDEKTLDAFHPFSSEGVARAQKLAEQFKLGAGVAIFSSRTTRVAYGPAVGAELNLAVEVAEACMDTAAIAHFTKNSRNASNPTRPSFSFRIQTLFLIF
jgi:phosphohistidine phosphatase SixA